MNGSQIGIAEAINKIENIYQAKYDPNSTLSVWDQLEICESIAETETYTKNYQSNNVIVNGNVNDTQKLQENSKLTTQKIELIKLLKLYNYRTPIYKVTDTLEKLFNEYESKEGHWSYIAHNYTLKSINSALHRMTKSYGDWKYINNPASYFTSLIKYYKKKKSIRLNKFNLKTKNSTVLQGRELAVD